MSDEQRMAPAMAPMPEHRHKNTWTILGVLFLVLLICSALMNVYLFMAWSDADDSIGMMDDDVFEEMEEERDEMMEDEDVGAMMEAEGDELVEIVFADASSTWGPQAVIELEGYLSTIERSNNLLPVTETDDVSTCFAFVVTDGAGNIRLKPDGAIALGDSSTRANISPLLFQDVDYLGGSSEQNPVRAYFLQGGSRFEGEAVGCMEPGFQLIGVQS